MAPCARSFLKRDSVFAALREFIFSVLLEKLIFMKYSIDTL